MNQPTHVPEDKQGTASNQHAHVSHFVFRQGENGHSGFLHPLPTTVRSPAMQRIIDARTEES